LLSFAALRCPSPRLVRSVVHQQGGPDDDDRHRIARDAGGCAARHARRAPALSAGIEQPSGALCGQVSVPENRAVKGGRQLALNVVVLPSRSAAGKSDPVFGLAGGPGFAATRLAVSYPRLYDLLQNDHDIVLVDQRGTGASNPLFCSRCGSGAVAGPSVERVARRRGADAVPRSPREDADLKQYTTSAAVDDLDAVRQALGYSRINLLGVSYGTRVALEYLRRYPRGFAPRRSTASSRRRIAPD
jgi:pimeloyl-ACP methyl ester carboxylesterase